MSTERLCFLIFLIFNFRLMIVHVLKRMCDVQPTFRRSMAGQNMGARILFCLTFLGQTHQK